MKLKDLSENWLNKYAKHTIKLRTYITYKNILEKHVLPVLGEYELEELTSSIIQDFVIFKAEKGNLNAKTGLTYNSINSILAVLKQILKYAYNFKFILFDVVNDYKLPQIREKQIDVFTNKELQILENYCLNSKNNHIGIVICLYTGIRIGELLALTWDDINFDKHLLSINKNVCTLKINGKNVLHIDTPKTKSSMRVIPIPKQLIPYLRKIKKSSKSNYIITTRNNTIVGTRAYQRSYERILNKLNIKYRNFHSLRHTFATRALELGMDVKSLSEILGHKDPSITLKRYSHSLLDYKIEMMNKLGKNIKKK